MEWKLISFDGLVFFLLEFIWSLGDIICLLDSYYKTLQSKFSIYEYFCKIVVKLRESKWNNTWNQEDWTYNLCCFLIHNYCSSFRSLPKFQK